MRVQYQVHRQGIETEISRVEGGECGTLLTPPLVMYADTFSSLSSRKKPSSVVSILLTIRIILTSLKERRWLLFRPRRMDMRCHLSILPTILSSVG